MTYQDFIKEFAPIMEVYGANHFPKMILERIHGKVRDLNRGQRSELYGLILDSCEFAPRVPKVIELANIVRARHRGYVAPAQADTPDPRGDPQAAERVRGLLKKAFGYNPKKSEPA